MSGFSNAPITKFLMCSLCVGTVFVSIMALKERAALFRSDIISWQFWRLFTNQAFVESPQELMIMCSILYFFRLFERLYGSSKFLFLLMYTWLMNALAMLAWFVWTNNSVVPQVRVRSGPYCIVYCLACLFVHHVPPSYVVNNKLYAITDKWFAYVLVLQAAFVGGWGVVPSAVAGVLSGETWRSGVLRLHQRAVARAWFAARTEVRPAPSNPLPLGALGLSAARQNIHAQRMAAAAQRIENNMRRALRTSPNAANIPNNNNNNAININNDNHRDRNPRPPLAPPPQLRQQPQSSHTQQRLQVSEENLQHLISMGFDEAGARRALVVSNDNVELAIEILLQINTNQ